MLDPINKAPLIAAQINLVNGEVSDAPVLEEAVENLYTNADTTIAAINDHLSAPTLPHADGSVTGPKLASSSVTDPKLATGAVLSRSLAANSVITEKVANQNITEPKLANQAVSSRTIANQAVQAQHIDPTLFAPYPDTAVWVKFADVDERLADTVTLSPSGGNDTDSFNAGIAKLSNGGVLYLANGDYYIDVVVLKSNIKIAARGSVRLLTDTTALFCNSGSADIANNLTNVTIDGVIFEAITKTFSEHIHLFSVSGISNLIVRNCTFIGFRGDGIYLGSGGVGEERHNTNVQIDNCVFDGVAHQNRNAISIIDVDGLIISNCKFRNCTKSDMPGAIDIEPNSNNFAVIRNVLINKNNLKNIGGNAGAIGGYFPLGQSALINPIQNITIEGNVIESTAGTQMGIHIRQVNATIIDYSTPRINIKVADNTVKGCGHFGGFFTGLRGVELRNNLFEENANGVILGSADAVVNKMIDVVVSVCRFYKTIGAVNGGLLIYTADDVYVDASDFVDCKFSGIIFMDGTSSKVTLQKNNFYAPTANMSVAVERRAGHTFTTSANIDKDNTYTSLIYQFQADNKDYFFKTTYDTSKLPESFVVGEETSMVDGDLNLPSASKQGILKTIRPIALGGAYNKYTIQWFYPANNDATTLADMYFRKGLTTDAWSAFKKLTGV
jgi:hypothetical protein